MIVPCKKCHEHPCTCFLEDAVDGTAWIVVRLAKVVTEGGYIRGIEQIFRDEMTAHEWRYLLEKTYPKEEFDVIYRNIYK